MNEQYDLVFDYKDNKHFNQDLNSLIRKSQSDNFEKWIFKGKNFDNFLPLTIINEKNEIIAALGITKFELYIGSKKCSGIQVGNFFIKESYKNEGLEKELLNAAIEKYSNVVDIIISYSSLIDKEHLIKSNFDRAQEYLYFLPWKPGPDVLGNKIKKLDLDLTADLELVQEKIKHSRRQSNIFDTKLDSSIKMFNILKNFSNDMYFIPSLDAVVCYKFKNGVFDLIAVFSHDKVDVMTLLNIVVPKFAKRVDFGFLPDLKEGLHIAKVDSFVRSSDEPIHSSLWIKEVTTAIESKKIMFPILSRQK